MNKKIADELLSVLEAIRAESQGFADFSNFTNARARSVLAKAHGTNDTLADIEVERIKKLTVKRG